MSTPLTTAVRFSTGNKIEMLITNAGHQQDVPSVMSHLTLHGKVETELSVALGSIQVLICCFIMLSMHLGWAKC